MNYIKTLEDLLQYGAKKAGYNEKLSVSFSDKKMGCDFQCNGVFALTKKYGKNPFDIANEIVNNIDKNTDILIYQPSLKIDELLHTAKELNIEILTLGEFNRKLIINNFNI